MSINPFRDDPLTAMLQSALDILTKTERDTGIETAATLDADKVGMLRVALKHTQQLLALSSAQARVANAAAMLDLDRVLEAVRFQLDMNPSPYSWAVTTFGPNALDQMEPLAAEEVRKLLRNYFGERGMSYEGWDENA